MNISMQSGSKRAGQVLDFEETAEQELKQQKNKGIDTAMFWGKFETPDFKTTFLPCELRMNEDDIVTLACPRVRASSFMRLLPSKPIPNGSIVSVAYEDKGIFELWSAEVKDFIGTSLKGLDEYKLSALKQEMTKSERKYARYLVEMPITMQTHGSKLAKVFYFSGAEVSDKGIGLWFPQSLKNRISLDEEFTITFEPHDVDVQPFSLKLACVRPNCADNSTKGFVAGFKILASTQLLSQVRLEQLIEARGKTHKPNLAFTGHYLASHWQGESLRELSEVS
jgi:hypothetical protein